MENQNNNMRWYDQLKQTPPEAKKRIEAGRLKGFTDIKTMWRIRRLTEVFGPCGIGWKVIITEQKLERANEEVKAFVAVDLFIKDGENWSEAIPGLGGSSFVSKEKGGLYVSDECYKMAMSDAIGSACRMLGMSEDVYWGEGYSKYSEPEIPSPTQPTAPAPTPVPAPAGNRQARKVLCPACRREVTKEEEQKGMYHFDAPLCSACASVNWNRRVRG